MDSDLTPDQKTFRDTTRNFLNKTSSSPQIRALADSGAGTDRTWWSQGAELGWTAMLVPEDLGGGTVSGEPLRDLCLVAREFGRTCAPGPLLTTSAVLTGLAAAGEAHAEAIEAIMTGDSLASWAFYEPSRGWDSSTPGTAADPLPGGGFTLSGTKDRVEAGESADLFLVTAHSPGGPVQVLVPRDTPGLSVTPSWSLDATRRFATLSFAGAVVPPGAVVQRGEAAREAVETQLHNTALLAAAEMTGALQAMFDVTVQWMFDRYTFGRPLASYQALKHRMADNKTAMEACLATTAGAAGALDSGAPDAHEMVSIAKAYVGDKVPAILQDFVQLHGGLGVTWEHDLHLYLRRTACDRALYGTPDEHRRRIAATLEGNAA
ncbi:acyl-CoA dehydrogenase family protein [Arthrobacter sp. zg-Y820]|uniref:acyl-CoA dehydrogenase family protein n=1 Tax=unclassified Arthrobacter TaxID=235627 RepID=UPI001E3F829F|nr:MULTISPECIES: acyl-CoA dehydrogenase family protein [unclassified Arthrobacter]MCC9197696.1 acyl-CoA/acyl-ACP dehydrogenase [Arthrobacter sp. zg-Y820]MDK1280563.1 acyl-CoA dehydrogenase family protein [Arthrobacter sp. zg.Y820]WIB10799.1 acyl-CoA dehydrogenase family protein [Arthrobacter sp. zg-Y820]